MKNWLGKTLAIFLCLVLIFQQTGLAQIAAQLDIASYLSLMRSTFVQDKFRPLHLRYLQFNPQENTFRLFLDKGDTKELSDSLLKNTSKTLIRYFLIGLTLPNDSFWVNLRPDSPDNIIDPYLEQTDIGRIMLETDLQLKKDTAQATSPQTPEGKEYWNKLYQKAEELFGNENVTIPTLTRPWIVPDEIIVRETTYSAYIYKATLKVMLEQDYLKDSATYNFTDPRLKALNEYSSQLIRESIIPKLTKEVNSAKRYASLRQVYYSLIMAQWFKARFIGKAGHYAELINTKNLANLTCKEAYSKDTYFKEYQKSFKDGEYKIQEPVFTPFGQTIRSYFSGGMRLMTTQPQQIPVSTNQAFFKRPYCEELEVEVNGGLVHQVASWVEETIPDRYKRKNGENVNDYLKRLEQKFDVTITSEDGESELTKRAYERGLTGAIGRGFGYYDRKTNQAYVYVLKGHEADERLLMHEITEVLMRQSEGVAQAGAANDGTKQASQAAAPQANQEKSTLPIGVETIRQRSNNQANYADAIKEWAIDRNLDGSIAYRYEADGQRCGMEAHNIKWVFRIRNTVVVQFEGRENVLEIGQDDIIAHGFLTAQQVKECISAKNEEITLQRNDLRLVKKYQWLLPAQVLTDTSTQLLLSRADQEGAIGDSQFARIHELQTMLNQSCQSALGKDISILEGMLRFTLQNRGRAVILSPSEIEFLNSVYRSLESSGQIDRPSVETILPIYQKLKKAAGFLQLQGLAWKRGAPGDPEAFDKYLAVTVDYSAILWLSDRYQDEIASGAKVLDLGAGTGGFYKAAKSRGIENPDITDVDINPEMQKLDPNPQKRNFSMAELGFAQDNSFDLAVAIFSIDQLQGREDIVNALSEIRRVVKKGARVAIATPSSVTASDAFLVLCGKLGLEVNYEGRNIANALADRVLAKEIYGEDVAQRMNQLVSKEFNIVELVKEREIDPETLESIKRSQGKGARYFNRITSRRQTQEQEEFTRDETKYLDALNVVLTLTPDDIATHAKAPLDREVTFAQADELYQFGVWIDFFETNPLASLALDRHDESFLVEVVEKVKESRVRPVATKFKEKDILKVRRLYLRIFDSPAVIFINKVITPLLAAKQAGRAVQASLTQEELCTILSDTGFITVIEAAGTVRQRRLWRVTHDEEVALQNERRAGTLGPRQEALINSARNKERQQERLIDITQQAIDFLMDAITQEAQTAQNTLMRKNIVLGLVEAARSSNQYLREKAGIFNTIAQYRWSELKYLLLMCLDDEDIIPREFTDSTVSGGRIYLGRVGDKSIILYSGSKDVSKPVKIVPKKDPVCGWVAEVYEIDPASKKPIREQPDCYNRINVERSGFESFLSPEKQGYLDVLQGKDVELREFTDSTGPGGRIYLGAVGDKNIDIASGSKDVSRPVKVVPKKDPVCGWVVEVYEIDPVSKKPIREQPDCYNRINAQRSGFESFPGPEKQGYLDVLQGKDVELREFTDRTVSGGRIYLGAVGDKNIVLSSGSKDALKPVKVVPKKDPVYGWVAEVYEIDPASKKPIREQPDCYNRINAQRSGFESFPGPEKQSYLDVLQGKDVELREFTDRTGPGGRIRLGAVGKTVILLHDRKASGRFVRVIPYLRGAYWIINIYDQEKLNLDPSTPSDTRYFIDLNAKERSIEWILSKTEPPLGAGGTTISDSPIGGIDFRSLSIVNQAMSNLSLNASCISLSSINLNQEWLEIQMMLESGITPSTERIKEYVQVSALKGALDQERVVSCIADIFRQEEERAGEKNYSSTDPVLKDILVVLESGRSPQELKDIFTGKGI